MVEDEPSYISYGETYEVNCARYGREPDAPIVQFKKRWCNAQGQMSPDPTGELRLQAYQEIETKFVVGAGGEVGQDLDRCGHHCSLFSLHG